MFSTDDSIVAIATPPGRGGIGIVRISGAGSREVAAQILDRPQSLEPRRATFTRIRATDEVVATYFPAPHSYTGEHVVEISAHGSPVVLQAIYSDGLTHVSLFIEPFQAQRHQAELNAAIGATHTLMVRLDDHWVTVVGDVPADTLKRFVTALTRKL